LRLGLVSLPGLVELLGPSDPSASASPVARSTGY
jgi:hypothetical protein